MKPNEQPILPDDVRAAIANAFPHEHIGPAMPTFGGYSNLTVLLPVGERTLVAKVAHTPPKRADIRREAQVLSAIHDSGLPIPKLVTILEEENVTIELLKHIEGANGMRFFGERQELLPELYAAVGRTLGAVHQHTLTEASPQLDLLSRYREAQGVLTTLDLPIDLVSRLHDALEHPIWQRPSDQLVHGDAGLHNVLWDNRLRALLDWEWAGRGLPLLDLAWTAWTMRFRNLDPSLWDGFLDAYTATAAHSPVATADELCALALGHITFILTRTAPDSWAYEEWQRRAYATLAYAFPTISP